MEGYVANASQSFNIYNLDTFGLRFLHGMQALKIHFLLAVLDVSGTAGRRRGDSASSYLGLMVGIAPDGGGMAAIDWGNGGRNNEAQDLWQREQPSCATTESTDPVQSNPRVLFPSLHQRQQSCFRGPLRGSTRFYHSLLEPSIASFFSSKGRIILRRSRVALVYQQDVIIIVLRSGGACLMWIVAAVGSRGVSALSCRVGTEPF